MLVKKLGLLLGDRGDDPGGVAELGEEPARAACSARSARRRPASGSRNSGSRLSIASLSEVPRPAKALPKPTRLVRALVRVAVSKVLLMSSNSVCAWKQPFSASSGIELAKVAGLGRQRAGGAVVGAVEGEALRRALALAADDLEVLEAERRAVADAEDRVLGQRLGGLVELQVEPRDRAAGVADALAVAAGLRRWWSPRRTGSRRSTRPRRPGGRRSGPRCCWSGGRRSGSRPRPGRRARTAARCWRCRRGRRRRSRSAS